MESTKAKGRDKSARKVIFRLTQMSMSIIPNKSRDLGRHRELGYILTGAGGSWVRLRGDAGDLDSQRKAIHSLAGRSVDWLAGRQTAAMDFLTKARSCQHLQQYSQNSNTSHKQIEINVMSVIPVHQCKQVPLSGWLSWQHLAPSCPRRESNETLKISWQMGWSSPHPNPLQCMCLADPGGGRSSLDYHEVW